MRVVFSSLLFIAVLNCSLLIDMAHAEGFDGHTVRLEIFSPNLLNPIITPLSALVGNRIEFLDIASAALPGITIIDTSIDVTDSSIIYKINSGPGKFGPAIFNGYVITDDRDIIPDIVNVRVNALNSNFPGFDFSRITFTSNSIMVNAQGLKYTPSTKIELIVQFAPEP